MSNITVKKIETKLTQVLDPELGISIVDMGLIYKISIKKNGYVNIKMTLTTIGCPLISTIEEDIKKKLEEIKINRNKVKIELTFDPPWTIERMTKKGKAYLGM